MNYLDPMIHDALVQSAGSLCLIGGLVFLIIMAAFWLGDKHEN